MLGFAKKARIPFFSICRDYSAAYQKFAVQDCGERSDAKPSPLTTNHYPLTTIH